MAGSSVTITRKRLGDVIKLKFAWVSDDAAGTASGATSFEVVGVPQHFTTVPSGGGTAPTDNYDITLKDEDGIDILNGLGADRSATLTQHKTGNDGLVLTAATALTLAVANAGNSKQGTAYLYLIALGASPL
jgi:hypothetical protein